MIYDLFLFLVTPLISLSAEVSPGTHHLCGRGISMLEWTAVWVDLRAWACTREVDIRQLHAVESFQNLPWQLRVGRTCCLLEFTFRPRLERRWFLAGRAAWCLSPGLGQVCGSAFAEALFGNRCESLVTSVSLEKMEKAELNTSGGCVRTQHDSLGRCL